MNAFDTIAKPVAETKSSKSTKLIASVTNAIKGMVDRFVNQKAQIKSLEADQASTEADIIAHVRTQQDEQAYAGNFSKSFTVPGINTEVTYVTSDRFSVPQDEETLRELRTLTGEKKFNEFFETKRAISLKDTAVKSEATLNKIAAACEKAGLNLAEIFVVGDKVFAKDDLDIKQYSLPKNKLPMFRAMVKQSKPALK